MDIPKIVLTGGPCAGKTAALTYLIQKLADVGYYPIIVQEAPTLLMTSGVTPTGGAFTERDFQEHVIRTMLFLEEEMERAAKCVRHPRPVIICDRGIMDARAYMSDELFWKITKGFGLDLASLRDRRYHGVIHLRSAAIGAEEFYTKANNVVRRETLEQAKAQDERTLQVWNGHAHLFIVKNEGRTFSMKLEEIHRSVFRILGIPEPLEIERKYLVASVDLKSLGVPVEVIDIEQAYIIPPDGECAEVRVRKRSQHGVSTYYRTIKQEVRLGVRIETERFSTESEYCWSLGYRDPSTELIRKKRHCLVFEHQYFELDVFEAPAQHKGLSILEIELTDERGTVLLPSGIDVLQEVTGDPSFSNRMLAQCSS